MKIDFYFNTSPFWVLHLTKMRLLTTPPHNHSYVVIDDKGLWSKRKRSMEGGFSTMHADPSPLPPTILTTRGFGMTRGCRSWGSGAGRHKILCFPRNILPPGPTFHSPAALCHPELRRLSLQGRSSEGSACLGIEQSGEIKCLIMPPHPSLHTKRGDVL